MSAEIKLAEIISFSTKGDVIGGLKRLIDRIEKGEYGNVRFVGAVIVADQDNIACSGWGRASDLEISGAFARASVLSGCCLVDNPAHEEEI